MGGDSHLYNCSFTHLLMNIIAYFWLISSTAPPPREPGYEANLYRYDCMLTLAALASTLIYLYSETSQQRESQERPDSLQRPR